MALAVDSPLRIVVVEDDAELREELLVPGLREHGFNVTGVATAKALYDVLRLEGPDVVVLDLHLPDADGFSVTQAVRALLPHVGIVVLTGKGELHDQLRGLDQGADAYLIKPARVELVAANIQSVARRLRGVLPPLQRWIFGADNWNIVSPSGRSVPLSRTEQRLIGRLAVSLGELVTREQLIVAVTDNVHDYDPHRIDSVIHRLRRKVANLCGESLPLSSVHGKGYVLHSQAPEALATD